MALRARTPVHNWVQKADLEPRSGRQLEKIAFDATILKVNGEQFWPYAPVDLDTNVILHVRLYQSRTPAVTKMFLREQAQTFHRGYRGFVEGAPWLQAEMFELGLPVQRETHGECDPVGRIFQEVNYRSEQFYNTFCHADPKIVESRLLAWSWAWNQLS